MKHLQDDDTQVSEEKMKDKATEDTLTFYSSIQPTLPDGTYTITVTQSLNNAEFTNKQTPNTFTSSYIFQPHRPRFVIPTTAIPHRYPPAHRCGIYGRYLPYIMFSPPSFPWDNGTANGTAYPNMVLLVLKKNELVLPNSLKRYQLSETRAITLTMQTSLSTNDATIQQPHIQLNGDENDLLAQHVYLPISKHQALVPTTKVLPYLAHCREEKANGNSSTYAVLFSDRLPQPEKKADSTTEPTAYYVHLVSLLGWLQPCNPTATAQYAHLISLASWSFISIPEQGETFKEAIQAIVKNTSNDNKLTLSTAETKEALPQLAAGYTPLLYHPASGDHLLSWYRGPLTPLPITPISLTDTLMTPSYIRASSGLMSYDKTTGLLDVTYACAWQLGRSLALENRQFSETLLQYRQQLRQTATPKVSHYDTLLHALATNWLGKQAHMSSTQQEQQRLAQPQPAFKAIMKAAHAQQQTQQKTSLKGATTQNAVLLAALVDWLKTLWLLTACPFHYLIPNPKLLPAESIRFFYLDKNWLYYLIMGALSVGIHGPRDGKNNDALFESVINEFDPSTPLNNASARNTTYYGFLLYSQLVSHWPTLVVQATTNNQQTLDPVRQSLVGKDTLMVFFNIANAQFPLTITITQPKHHMRMGVHEDDSQPNHKKLCIYYKNWTQQNPWQAVENATNRIPVQVDAENRLPLNALLIQLKAKRRKTTTKSRKTTISSVEFALQLLHLPERACFTINKANNNELTAQSSSTRYSPGSPRLFRTPAPTLAEGKHHDIVSNPSTSTSLKGD